MFGDMLIFVWKNTLIFHRIKNHFSIFECFISTFCVYYFVFSKFSVSDKQEWGALLHDSVTCVPYN